MYRPAKYCKTGNFRAFRALLGEREIKMRENVYFVCRSMEDSWKQRI